MKKKVYQCEECKGFFDEDDIVVINPAQSTGIKKKLYVCSKCYYLTFNKKKED